MPLKARKNITFILPSLVAGGAERVISYVAQNLDNEKFNATLLITGQKEDTVYKVEHIEIVYLEKKRVLNAVFKIFCYLKIHKPDVVLSSIGHLNTVLGLMAPLFPSIKFIIREASVVSTMKSVGYENKSLDIFGKIRSVLALKSYRFVDHIICQSQDMAVDFAMVYKIKDQKISIINNPITQKFPFLKEERQTTQIIKFLTIGRLSKEKGHLRILKMLSKLEFKFHYTIIGEGPLKKEILDLINSYNLNEKITYIPFTDEVYKYMSSSDLFLQGSYVEGFPNTVLESCFAGTPVIAFNVPGGTKEIIIHEENGYLVENEADYIYYLNNRLNLSPIDIRNSVEKRFNSRKIIAQYETLFN